MRRLFSTISRASANAFDVLEAGVVVAKKIVTRVAQLCLVSVPVYHKSLLIFAPLALFYDNALYSESRRNRGWMPRILRLLRAVFRPQR